MSRYSLKWIILPANGVEATDRGSGSISLRIERADSKSGKFRLEVAPRSGVDGVAVRGFVVLQDRVYYLRQEPGGGMTLRRLMLSTGNGSLVSSPLKRLELGLSVSPDEKYAIYSQVDHEGSGLMLVEGFRKLKLRLPRPGQRSTLPVCLSC